MSAVTTLHMPRPHADAIRAHAESSYPRECCGILIGTRQVTEAFITQVLRCENIHGQPATHYTIDPRELLQAQRRAREHGQTILGFYHSHPDHAARLSPTDEAQAYWTGCAYVIASVIAGEAREIRGWLLEFTGEHSRFRPLDLVEDRITGSRNDI